MLTLSDLFLNQILCLDIKVRGDAIKFTAFNSSFSQQTGNSSSGSYRLMGTKLFIYVSFTNKNVDVKRITLV